MWYKDNSLITNGHFSMRNNIDIQKNNSIIIRNVTREDAGDYYCEVLPNKVRLHAALIVDDRLTIYIDGRDVTGHSVTFREGEKHKIECKIYLNTPFEIKWSFNVSMRTFL